MIALAAFSAAAQQPASASPATTDFAPCVAQLRTEAQKRGIDGAAFDGWFAGVEPDATAIELMDRQPEFTLQPWDYLAMLVDEKRVADGRRKLASLAELLERIEAAYGVERHVLVALWGVETRFGERMGSRPLIRSLATVSCFGRRQPFFREELMAALRILKDGDVPIEHLVGSWAGAFGHTQFMPSTFRRVAVDFDGDGRRDLVDSVPDALASTANYLARAGWKRGEPWGHEVRLPRKYLGPSGRRTKLAMGDWRALGIKRIDGRALPGEEIASLLLPAGANGPAFVVMNNFTALLAYNPADVYALAIAHLSDRLRGGGAIQASWPKGEPALSREQRISIQERLSLRGFDVGTPDGIIGPRTVDAIKEFQKSLGLTPDGFPTVGLLGRL
ncbi:MAG: lytic murein transglycosylase [Usitatibacter sp.]